MSRSRHRPGYTLLEMMVVVLIAAIVLAAGVPALQSMVRRQRVVSAANDFFHAAHLTRATALRHGRSVEMRPTSGDDWRRGWVIRVDKQLVMTRPALDREINVTFNRNGNRVAYHADGRPDGFNTWRFIGVGTERRVIINFLGRIRICDPLGPAAC